MALEARWCPPGAPTCSALVRAASIASATTSERSGSKCPYWSGVMVADLWPSICCSTLMSAPAARLAAVWRNSWGVSLGRPRGLTGLVERTTLEDA
jgi:hypothetical protein